MVSVTLTGRTPIDAHISDCLINVSGGTAMVYDWDGRKTRRLQIARLVTAVAVGLVAPLLVAALPAMMR
jgi:hypothetical protein